MAYEEYGYVPLTDEQLKEWDDVEYVDDGATDDWYVEEETWGDEEYVDPGDGEEYYEDGGEDWGYVDEDGGYVAEEGDMFILPDDYLDDPDNRWSEDIYKEDDDFLIDELNKDEFSDMSTAETKLWEKDDDDESWWESALKNTDLMKMLLAGGISALKAFGGTQQERTYSGGGGGGGRSTPTSTALAGNIGTVRRGSNGGDS